jgi:hypothetical protein
VNLLKAITSKKMGSTSFSIEGSLYELVARGNKDVYFIDDLKDSKNLFDNRYGPTPPLVHELRRLPPLNAPDFGKSIEFQLEIAGDVCIEPTLIIDLPSWLPRTFETANPTAIVTDLSGVSYGYTNGIGFFLFEKIQLLQDNILIQEFSGDALWSTGRTRGTLNSAFLADRVLGIHDGSPLSIGRNASPGRLRLPLPLFGCQSIDDGGLPLVCIPQQAYKIRCWLRKLEDLVESSDGQMKPTPWTTTLQIQTQRDGALTQFSPLDRISIGTPTIVLETRHIYTDGETQKALKESRLEIPFERIYENVFTQAPHDYAPLSRGATAAITRRLDATHPSSRIINLFRSMDAVKANQWWKIDNAGGDFYGNLKLVIAGKDRETLFSSLVWNDLVTHAKSERDPGLRLAIIDWTVGDIRGRRAPFPRQPEGSINFTTADRPSLYIELANTAASNTILYSFVETWAVMLVEKYRATLLFGN